MLMLSGVYTFNRIFNHLFAISSAALFTTNASAISSTIFFLPSCLQLLQAFVHLFLVFHFPLPSSSFSLISSHFYSLSLSPSHLFLLLISCLFKRNVFNSFKLCLNLISTFLSLVLITQSLSFDFALFSFTSSSIILIIFFLSFSLFLPLGLCLSFIKNHFKALFIYFNNS